MESSTSPSKNVFNWIKRNILTVELNAFHVIALLVIDFIISVTVVKKIAYTEIDWKAYMEEVEGYLDGETDYRNLRGNTGPLVYPAGFLYVYSVLRYLTNAGTDILTAQYIFISIYLMNLLVVLGLYLKNRKFPALLAVALILSKRIHSIFMLRMFNDCIAAFLGYVAIYCYTNRQWELGSIVYSSAVSIKMNMFLYAPGVFLVLLFGTGISKTIWCITLCAIVQVVLGFPFLSTYPYSYLGKAFELGRVFEYKWTVNYRFLSEEIFVSKPLAMGLLACTVIAYLIFLSRWTTQMIRGYKKEKGLSIQVTVLDMLRVSVGNISNEFIINTILISNILGIIFARSLHYQFYSWYFHSLPIILWNTKLPVFITIFILFAIEISYNVYPSTVWSSILLQGCHIIILMGILFFSDIPYDEGKQLFHSYSKKKSK